MAPLLISLLLFVLSAFFIRSQLNSVEPLDNNAAPNIFSSARAFAMLESLTKEQIPHPVDSTAGKIVEQRIATLLSDMGYVTEIQDTQICDDSTRGYARCTKIRNIIVHIKGTDTDNGILLSAHYDSVPASPGGSDAGAAVVTLLETARLLSLSKPPKNSIVLLFNEGEEFGLFGAKAFMQQHPLANTLKLAINIEARGSSGKSVMFETGENSGWLVQHYAQTSKAPLSSSLFYEVYKFLPNNTDLTVFKKHGLQGLNFAHAERLPHYHTPLDNLENLDRGSLQEHGDNVWGILAKIKDQDLNLVNQGNLVYSDIMGLFVVKWSEPTSLYMSLIMAGLLVLICYLLAKQKQLNLWQFSKGLFAIILILITSALAGLFSKLLVQWISGTPIPWYSNQLPMQLSLWLCVALLGLIVGRGLARKATTSNMLLAVAIIFTLLSLVTSILMPGISFLFIIPMVTAVIALTIITTLNASLLAKQTKANLHIATLIVLSLISAITFMPIAYVLEIMVGYGMALAIGIVLSFVVISLLPLLTFKINNTKAFNKLIYTLALGSFISIVWTSYQAPYTPLMPQHINLQYVQQGDDDALILKGKEQKLLPELLANALTNKTQIAKALPWSNNRFYTTEVQSEKLDQPEVTITHKATDKSEKQVTLRISTSPDNLSDIIVYVPISSGLQSIATGNEVITYKDEKSTSEYYRYQCRGMSCANIQLELNFSQQQTSTIYISSVYAGLPATFDELKVLRGNNAVPYQAGDQSIIYSKVEL